MKRRFFFSLCVLVLGQASADAAETTDLKSIHKILILGDSITFHSPAPEVGWTGKWGMAASSADRDYVHLFLKNLAAAGVPAPQVWIFGEGGGKITDKLPFDDKITAFHADLALVQLGENDNKDLTAVGFEQPYEKLLAAIRAGNPSVRILCAGVWGVWPTGDQTKNVMIRTACRKYGASFADLGASYADPATHALSENRFTNTAVNWHPGDRGMIAYANAFWKALSGLPPATVAADAPTEQKPFIAASETWGDPRGLAWTPIPPVVQDAGMSVAKVSSTGEGRQLFTAPLDISLLSGREVRIRTKVRGELISALPQPWNGVKVMLRVRDAENKPDYPQFRLPAGTFDWMDVDWTVRIPENAVSVDLIIGLEDVSGTAWFNAIEVTAGAPQ